jgi:DNA repair exonuclease SbcCD ATPase subunit
VPRLLQVRARGSEPKASTNGGTPTPNTVLTSSTVTEQRTLSATVVSSQETQIRIQRKPVSTRTITEGTRSPAAASTNAEIHAAAQEKERELQTLRDQLQLATQALQTAEVRRESACSHATALREDMALMSEMMQKEIAGSSRDMRLMEETLRGARMEATRLRVQLEIERERTAITEEKAKALSDQLAAEITSKTIASSTAQNKLKTLETERDNWKKKLSDDAANFERRLTAIARERESDRRVAQQQQQRLSQELVAAKAKAKDTTKKKQELETTIGAPIAVVRVGKWAEDDLNKLTRVMINHMRTVVQTFAKTKPIKKIEYLMNAELYKKYDETRSKFWSAGRSGSEVIAYHGTSQRNIDLYNISHAQLIATAGLQRKVSRSEGLMGIRRPMEHAT